MNVINFPLERITIIDETFQRTKHYSNNVIEFPFRVKKEPYSFNFDMPKSKDVKDVKGEKYDR